MIYERKSRLTGKQQGKLIDYFVAGTTARTAAELVGVQPNTAIRFFMRLRQLIASRLPSYVLSGEIEIDIAELSNVRKRKKGSDGRAKVALFGLSKHDGKVLTAIFPYDEAEAVLPGNEGILKPDCVVYTDPLRSCSTVDIGELRYKRTNHTNLSSDKQTHISEIENFWNQAKRHLLRFNGIKKASFFWFLKECEWRFNGGNHQQLLKQLKYWYKTTKH